MRLTHLGHACLLVETADQRILIDPGCFSPGFEELADLDAILVTHQHTDHVDVERLPRLLELNPGARLLVEAQTAEVLLESDIAAQNLVPGEPTRVGPVEVTPVGQLHAVNHDRVPRVGNTGVVLRADGEPSLFHPGDAYDVEPGDVDVLALPLSAPWCAVRDTLAFVRSVAPRYAVPVHDATLSEVGRALYLHHVSSFGPEGMEVIDLAGGSPREIG
ncbi:MAG: MBL fold metallo-hydrolase [Oryzihumus sp.]